MKVDVYNREQACKLIPDANKCFISIWTPLGDWSSELDYNDSPIKTGWADTLKLTFHDVTYMGHKDWVLFNHDMARKIVMFIQKNINKNFVVHCDAGISRSVAVGCYLRDQYGYELKLNAWPTDEHRNNLVYGTLMLYR